MENDSIDFLDDSDIVNVINNISDEDFLSLNPDLTLEDKGGWIQKAISKPGAFRAQAKRSGMSTKAYARHVLRKGSRATQTTKRRARLAQTLSGMRKRK